MPRILFATLIIVGMVIARQSHAQVVELYTGVSPYPNAAERDDVSVLNAGLLDIGVRGELQSTAQILKIRIGEPKGFNIPFYLLTGTASGDLGDAETNKSTLFQLLDPVGGVVSANLVGTSNLWHSKSGITQFRLAYTGSGRVVTGRHGVTGDSRGAANLYLATGIFFQTGAWEGDDGYDGGGVFWSEVDYAASFISADDLRAFFGNDAGTSPSGVRATLGLKIKGKVNVKFALFIPTSREGIVGLDSDQFKLGLDYSVRKE